MNYSDFVSQLNENSELELVFDFNHSLIRSDYHITEVLNSQISAIDCGKSVSRWNETIFQLYEPQTEKHERHMKVRKALAILNKSNEAIQIPKDANVILEFRPKDSNAAQRYNVSGLKIQDKQVIVETEGATTQCKPAQNGKTGCC